MRKRVFNIRNSVTMDNNFKSCFVYDLNTDCALYSKNENKVSNIASLTKMMTAILLVESNIPLNKKITVKPKIVNNISKLYSLAGLEPNEVLTKEDLLYAILLPSGADACKVTSDLFGGKKRFVKKMNKKAKKMGLKHTHYMSEIGTDQVGNYSTASDLAKILKYMINNRVLRKVLLTMEYTTSSGRVLKHTILEYSEKFKNDITYLTGGKTGSTLKSGLCIALLSKHKDKNLLFIGLGVPIRKKKCSDHMIQANMILDYVYTNYEYKNIITNDEVFYSKKPKFSLFKINLKLKKDLKLLLPKDTEEIKYTFKRSKCFRLTSKLIIGEIIVKNGKKVVCTKPIMLKEIRLPELLIKLFLPVLLGLFVIAIYLFLKLY